MYIKETMDIRWLPSCWLVVSSSGCSRNFRTDPLCKWFRDEYPILYIAETTVEPGSTKIKYGIETSKYRESPRVGYFGKLKLLSCGSYMSKYRVYKQSVAMHSNNIHSLKSWRIWLKQQTFKYLIQLWTFKIHWIAAICHCEESCTAKEN